MICPASSTGSNCLISVPKRQSFLQFWYFFIFGILHRLHNAGCLFQLRDRMACNDLQSLHQHTVLVVCDRHCLICRTGPPECTIIESLVHKEKTIAFPEQCFDPIASSSTEKKQCIFVVRIKLKLKAYDRCQSIDPTRRSVNPIARYTFLNPEASASFSMGKSLYEMAEHFR